MSFGKVWRTRDASFWDGMWTRHKGSPMTKRMLGIAAEHQSVCEVGCGHGHFLQALLDTGWRGRFVGFEMSPGGTERVADRCRKADIEHDVFAGDFLEWAASGGDAYQLLTCDVATCRGVVQHQAHWLPMTLAMLRTAPLAVVGIGYVSTTEFHEGSRRAAGHYDIQVSPKLLVREARAVGLQVQTHSFKNKTRGCDELLAICHHQGSWRR